jgi:LacI family transcriptional regulator
MAPTDGSRRPNDALKVPARRRVLLALGWYAGKIHEGVARYARDASWILNLDMMRSGTFPTLWHGDGIIAILGSNSRMDRALMRLAIPVVNIGPIDRPGVPSVRPNDDAIARLASAHFRERGFRRFAFYARSGGPGERARCERFRAHVAKSGGEFHVIDWAAAARPGRNSDAARLRFLRRQLEALPKPLAVFSEYDDRSVEVLQACEISKLPVPEQVAVLGVDNDELRCEFAPTPLSSIDDDQERQGFEAAALLDRVMRGRKPPAAATIVEPRGVVVRRSTDILAVDHPQVAEALRIVWEHYTDPITAQDVERAVPMSGRRLHDAFLKHIGRSIAGELSRRRVERAEHLLRDRSMKLPAIATACGFSSANHLARVFKRSGGRSPQAFRRSHLESSG